MGVVYAAEDLQTGRQVALKVVMQPPDHALLLPGLRDTPTTKSRPKDRFVTEVQTTARLDHPNIVTVFTAERTIDYAYYTMKLVDGVDLHRLIELLFDRHPRSRPWRIEEINELLLTSDSRPLCSDELTRSVVDATSVAESSGTVNRESRTATNAPDASATQESEQESLSNAAFDDEVFKFFALRMAETAEAIAYANTEGVLHRDIKPSNLIIDRQGKIYVTDFGLAKWKPVSTEEDSTACVGTRGYIAPECLQSASSVGQRSEVFSFGCVLHKLMTLCPTRPPNPADASWQTDARSVLPTGLYAIIRKAIAAEPTDRYSTVAELAQDLRRFAEGRPVEAAKLLRRAAWSTRSLITSRSTMITAAILGVICLSLAFQVYRQSIANRTHTREMNRLATAEKRQSQRADAAVDLLLEQLEESYRSAGEEILSSGLGPPPARVKLHEETRLKLHRGVDICRRLLGHPGESPPDQITKIASLLRKSALIYESGGEAEKAAEQYGLAASALDRLGDSEFEVTAERCWLRYLETRYRHAATGFAAQAEVYEQILASAETSLGKQGLDTGSRSRLHEVAGLVELARERYARAAKHLSQVDQPEFGKATLRRTLLTAYRMGGQHRMALPKAEQFVKDFPKDDEAWRELAGLRLHLGEVDAAQSAFERCVELNPTNGLGWHGLAWSYFRDGDTKQAIEFVNKAHRLSPRNETVLMARAKFYVADDRRADAVVDLREALSLRPTSPYVVYPGITTLLFWEQSDSEDLSLCRQIANDHADDWPSRLAGDISALIQFRSRTYRDLLEINAKDVSESPVRRLMGIAARCLAGDETQQTRSSNELRQWRDKGWQGLDDSSSTRIICDYVACMCLDRHDPE